MEEGAAVGADVDARFGGMRLKAGRGSQSSWASASEYEGHV